MNKAPVLLFVFLIFVFPGVAAGQGIVVDHTSIGLFDQIPDQYLQAARNLRVAFMNRSVGVNTHESLNCFTAASYGASPVTCRTDYQFVNGSWVRTNRTNNDLSAGRVPAYIRFDPNPTRFDRSRWLFYLFYAAWDKMADDFITGLHNRAIPVGVYPGGQQITINPLDFDVLSFQFSYLNVEAGSTIADYFTHRPGNYDDVYDLDREVSAILTNANPPRVFVYWTTSLARGIGTDTSTNFNEQMRQWCRTNNKVLFDFADIESHDMYGNPCYDNRDGVRYTTPTGGASEDYPDDGRNIPAICQEKTTETDGGHIGTAQGAISVAKGFWITMARIAGWNPTGGSAPAPPTNLRAVPD